jgi:ubiquinone/menaquinone biosynthesis C-methylase UbiE
MQAARVLDGGVDADADDLSGACRGAKLRLDFDARHAEPMRVEQRLPRSPERREHFLFGVFKPAKEIREPHHAGGVGVGPVNFFANLKEGTHWNEYSQSAMKGHEGWDDYAAYYDWENKQTVGRRDIAFWQRMAAATLRRGRATQPILELGCGTGRVAIPLGKTGARVIGIDRSATMLARARARVQRGRLASAVQLVRGDIRHLPFPDNTFPLVMAPYGILQSLLDEDLLRATLRDVYRVLTRGGTFGLELVADLPAWDEYANRTTLRSDRGPHGGPIKLIETVKQDRKNHITRFEQEFVEGRGKAASRKKFKIAFRTLTVPQMAQRLERAGLEVSALLGDYQGGPWDLRAEVWIILARRG